MSFWRNRHEVRDVELNQFVDGELEDPARLRVERHIESCAPCSKAVAELLAVSRAMSELPAVRAPRSFALRQADLEAAEPANGGTGLFGSVTPLLSGVAAIAIVAFVVLAGIDLSSGSSQSDNSEAASIAGALESQLSATDQYRAEYSDAAPPVSDAAAPRDADVPSGDETLRDDLEYSVGNDAEEPLALEPDVPPEEIVPAPEAGESTGRDVAAADGNALVDDGGDSSGLRVAESVAAAVALTAGGSVLLIWWRRRATDG